MWEGLTLPRREAENEQPFRNDESAKIIANSPEPFATIWSIPAMLGLTSSETLALSLEDVSFEDSVIHVGKSLDERTRTLVATKNKYRAAPVPMPPELADRLRAHIESHYKDNPDRLLFTNKQGRPYSANKLREKILNPLLKKLGLSRGAFHAWRHGTASEMLQEGVAIPVVQRQLRHNSPKMTLLYGSHIVDDAQRVAVDKRSKRLEKSIQLEPSGDSGARFISN
jgi:integrase